MVFHWSLSDSESPQVSRILLNILAVLNNAVLWMVSTRPPTSKSSSPFSTPLVTVQNAPITIGIQHITRMFHSFFNSLARSRYLSFFFIFFQFYSVVNRDNKVDNFTSSLFLLLLFDNFTSSLFLLLFFWPRLGEPWVCQSPIGVYVCYFLEQVLGCAYTICLYGQI